MLRSNGPRDTSNVKKSNQSDFFADAKNYLIKPNTENEKMTEIGTQIIEERTSFLENVCLNIKILRQNKKCFDFFSDYSWHVVYFREEIWITSRGQFLFHLSIFFESLIRLRWSSSFTPLWFLWESSTVEKSSLWFEWASPTGTVQTTYLFSIESEQ